MARLERYGLVKDWTVKGEFGNGGSYDTAVNFFDIPAGKAGVKLSISPPWAR
jgi:hypothetical protein